MTNFPAAGDNPTAAGDNPTAVLAIQHDEADVTIDVLGNISLAASDTITVARSGNDDTRIFIKIRASHYECLNPDDQSKLSPGKLRFQDSGISLCHGRRVVSISNMITRDQVRSLRNSQGAARWNYSPTGL